MAFPAVPSSYVTVQASSRSGIYVGPSPTPSFTLSASGPTGYIVRDRTGTSVSSGSVSGTTVAPTAPAGGWAYGWYRLYLTGTTTGAYSFCVIRNDSRFVPNAATSVADATNNGAGVDEVTRGLTVMGPSRYAVADATSSAAAITEIQTCVTANGSYYTNPSYLDAARPRPLLVSFPNGGYDTVTNSALRMYCKDGTIDGSTTFVGITTGTTGNKITVYSPNNTTVVETYDNLTTCAAAATALQRSAYLRGFISGTSGAALTNIATVAIGNAKYNGVKAVVVGLYPTVTRFEGPENEPPQNASSGENAHKMKLFSSAVKAGNASALVVGPQFVTANLGSTVYGSATAWDDFFATGGHTYCDELSFHAYNMLFGDINMMRRNLDAFKALLAKYAITKPFWQTEQGSYAPVYGVYHPRRARWQVTQLIVQEMYGIPKERNHVWYDTSNGFWSQPAWWKNADKSLNPQVQLIRVLSEEVFGKTFASALDFGKAGNNCYVGGTWTAGDGTGCAILLAASAGLPNVVLTVTGSASSLTYSDADGQTGTLTVTSGAVTVPVSEFPTYLRLPAGVSVTVKNVVGWPTASKVLGNHLAIYPTASSSPAELGNGLFPVGNSYDSGGDPYTGSATPTTATVQFKAAQYVDHVIVFSGFPWQSSAPLTDFDLQTSPDGTTWTTRQTVTVTPPTSIAFVTGWENTGCSVETYWDERYVFDIQFAPVSALAIRVNARSVANGGEPDASSTTAGGQGTATPVLTLQELVVMLDQQVASPKFVAPVP